MPKNEILQKREWFVKYYEQNFGLFPAKEDFEKQMWFGFVDYNTEMRLKDIFNQIAEAWDGRVKPRLATFKRTLKEFNRKHYKEERDRPKYKPIEDECKKCQDNGWITYGRVQGSIKTKFKGPMPLHTAVIPCDCEIGMSRYYANQKEMDDVERNAVLTQWDIDNRK